MFCRNYLTFGMKQYEYPEAKNVIVCGDIHGDFHALAYKLCIQYGLTDTLLIVAGDCGFGFDKPTFYQQIYNKDAGRLRKSNNWIAFVRGNHDDPAYFNEEKIAFKHWRTIPDYSIITACGHNILCVGGAISVDREDRKQNQARCIRKNTGCYWPDEAPVFSKDTIESLSVPVDTVVSHTAPSFCEKIDHSGLNQWAKHDPTLLDDVASERNTMDKIYGSLKASGHPVGNWYYGHFHESWTSFINNIRFKMLNIIEFYEFSDILPNDITIAAMDDAKNNDKLETLEIGRIKEFVEKL